MSRERVRIVAFLFNDNDDIERIEYESYLRAFKLSSAQVLNVNVLKTAPVASMLDGAHAVLIGGSRNSVWEDYPNAAALTEVIKAARAKKLPMIGVCFGAQFLSHIFGGKVVRDMAKAERGTFEVTTSDDSFTDMLFADVPFSFPAQCAHHDCIVTPPTSAVVLASSAVCPVQAFGIPGADIYGVQFHPERSKEDYEKMNAIDVQNGKKTPEVAAAINAKLSETKETEELLAKFIDRIVLQK